MKKTNTLFSRLVQQRHGQNFLLSLLIGCIFGAYTLSARAEPIYTEFLVTRQ